ncbi:hypothetical protein KFK09_012930 [Dendrobium nobile]|uniref:Leucine-rich repeat-containing N-terminal plant-type domain-containing protein n=1 Tax=Dendrobium nobile TaxID=94219 RepID=A0A8T3BK89_DENNO|nr:hypothetical protein KFK09_012930 [Dendrobium nobile]
MSPIHPPFLFLFFFLFLHCSAQSSLSPTDRQALLNIRQNLFDLPGSTFFSSWDFSSDPCLSFSGITCSPDDDDNNFLRVSVLTLGTGLTDSPGLGGILPTSISNLSALTELVIFPGRITGQIPTNLGGSLPLLRLLSISSNLLLGPIPPSLSNLPFLHTLDLSQNQLQDSLPPSLLSSNPSLKVLILAYNGGLTGPIPSQLTSAPNLLHLDLRGNSFTGFLPPLPSTLRFLSVSINSLSGPLPPISPALEFLDLSNNVFSGEIPPAIFSLPRLSSILLNDNNFSGNLSLPLSSDTTVKWAVVDVSHNMLTGEPPAGLAAADSLYLNDNQFTGAVPAEYIESIYNGSMTTFYAQSNFLSVFSLPPATVGMAVPASASLCLSHNCMLPPPAATTGCPASAQAHLSRPSYQCAAVSGGD